VSRIRLYLDEDALDNDLIAALRARAVDVITVAETGTLQDEDEEQLKRAVSTGRVLYTFNISDYSRLHKEWLASGRSHTGLILGPQQWYTVGEQMKRILRIIGSLSAEEMKDRLEYLSNWD
jgi:hypothetical protein